MTPILDTIRSIINAPSDTAKAREALSQALTGRVLPDPKPQPKEAEHDNPLATRR